MPSSISESNRLIVGNWKMALGAKASKELAKEIAQHCTDLKKTTVWLAPSLLAIPGVVEACRNSSVVVGAQNVHWESKGAFTGEISAPDLIEAGCRFAIVGHSERRAQFSEGFDLCARRALGALTHGLKIIFCIGETQAERKDALTREVLEAQLMPFLSKLAPEHLDLVTIAYEPVWAIGTGLAATIREIEENHSLIETSCKAYLNGKTLPILYGGSVAPDNFSAFMHSKLVTGVLVGSASLSLQKWVDVIRLSEAS